MLRCYRGRMLIAAVALGALGLLLTASLGLWVADYATGW